MLRPLPTLRHPSTLAATARTSTRPTCRPSFPTPPHSDERNPLPLSSQNTIPASLHARSEPVGTQPTH